MANLDSYDVVKTHLFVRVYVDEYRTTSGGSYTTQLLTFSDADSAETINGETYTPLGEFLSITQTTSELRPSTDTITIGFTGVPSGSIDEILYSKLKGSSVRVYRKFYTISGTPLATQGYFFGKINNFSIQEEYNVEERTSQNIILLECASNFSVLQQKISGRKTNQESEKKFFPSDDGMNRVAIVKGTKFDFGAP